MLTGSRRRQVGVVFDKPLHCEVVRGCAKGPACELAAPWESLPEDEGWNTARTR